MGAEMGMGQQILYLVRKFVELIKVQFILLQVYTFSKHISSSLLGKPDIAMFASKLKVYRYEKTDTSEEIALGTKHKH
eukprot:366054-Pleurochrysis_carterae.AAC.3